MEEEQTEFEKEWANFIAKQKQLDAKVDVACSTGDKTVYSLAVADNKSGLTVSQLGSVIDSLADISPITWKSNDGVYVGHDPWAIGGKCKIDTGITKMNSNDAMLLEYLKKQFTPIAENCVFTELGEKLKAKLREKLGDDKICIRVGSDGNVYIESRCNNAIICSIMHNLVNFMVPYTSEAKSLFIRGEEDLYKVVKGIEILNDYWEEDQMRTQKLRHMLNALDVFE